MPTKPTRRGASNAAATIPLVEHMQRAAQLRAGAARRLRVAGLFAGIGGLELGLHRAGHTTDLLCEIEPGACSVLRARFPEIPLHDDVCTLRSLPRTTDLVVAGFPCQDLSQAGKTAGIEGSKSGLVGEVFRLLRCRRVPWVLLENVPFMLQLSRGRAMEVIVASLEALGYKWAYRVVNTQAFGLPQRRERVLMLASMDEDPRRVLFSDEAPVSDDPEKDARRFACGFYWTEGVRGLGWAVDAVPTLKGGSTIGIPSPPAILMPDGRLVTPDLRDAERMQGFQVDWTKPAETVGRASHRWKLVGNAVTVDVARWLGERLILPSDDGLGVPGAALDSGRPWPRAAWNVGQGRFSAQLSAFPERRKGLPLQSFLRFAPKPLSIRATAGFLSRTSMGRLNFPDDFLVHVSRHLHSMQAAQEHEASVSLQA